ncbi:Uncharacterised protein [Bordetella pertussis]|nr:Uncharacterised protein [Bordetella pertussis]
MKRLSSRMRTRVALPTARLYPLVLPSSTACASCQSSRSGPPSSVGMANSLGSWLASTTSAMPFM